MKLYVGNLTPEVEEDSIRELFENLNIKVTEIALRKGYAFVDCPEQEQADDAIDKLNRYKFMGTDIVVEPSFPKTKTFRVQIKNTPQKISIEDLQDLLKTFGRILKFETLNNPPNTHIITYGSMEEAEQVIEKLNNKELEGETLDVGLIPPRRPRARNFNGNSNSSSNNRGTRRGVSSYNNNNGQNGRNIIPKVSEFPLKISVPSEMVGAIIGRKGETIRTITQQSHARIDVFKKDNSEVRRNFMMKPRDMSLNNDWQTIMIVGSLEACTEACKKILEIMNEETKTNGKGEIPLKILAHNNLIGRIIGKNGNNVKQFMAESDARITVSSGHQDVDNCNMERTITIKGPLDKVIKAQTMITAKLKQSYESDLAAMRDFMFPGLPNYGGPRANSVGLINMANYFPGLFFGAGNGRGETETVFLYIPYASVGAIIGTKGSNIRNVKNQSGAQIIISPPEKADDALSKARKVTIIGTPEAQWKAQFHIFEKIQNEGFAGMDEVSLTCQIFVPTPLVGRIIGRKGQNVQELQKLTGASINVSEEGNKEDPPEESCISIQGPFYPNQSAQRRIRAIIAQTRSTSAPPLRRRRVGGNNNNPEREREQPLPQLNGN
ncbi:unnamed protein product [Gordionus sp. m RMFG-2023]|uniref:insulin-like growth factor 2 mRNA-binding protein 1 isoform X1 n=1 Tax=Gordionus sp. m RMFG-2023 TaxID=3053472 RepID=UPI0030E3C37D